MNASDVVLIHGSFFTSAHMDDLAAFFDARGMRTHAPTLRHHELEPMAAAVALAGTSMADYTADLVDLCRSLDGPPLLLGHSMGGLLAQLVAARVPHSGLVLLAPAPAAGIFALYPSMLRLFTLFYAQPAPWRRVMWPTWQFWRYGVTNEQDDATAREHFTGLRPESGQAYWEMGFPQLDRRKATTVDTSRVSGPVLVIAGGRDRIVPAGISRATARRFPGAEISVLPEADHMLNTGRFLPQVERRLDTWLQAHLAPAPGTGGAAPA